MHSLWLKAKHIFRLRRSILCQTRGGAGKYERVKKWTLGFQKVDIDTGSGYSDIKHALLMWVLSEVRNLSDSKGVGMGIWQCKVSG